MVPSADAGNVDARARDLCLDALLARDQLFSLRLIVTADLNELKIRILDEIKSRRSRAAEPLPDYGDTEIIELWEVG